MKKCATQNDMMSFFKKFSKTNLSTKRSGLNTTTRINTQTRLNTQNRTRFKFHIQSFRNLSKCYNTWKFGYRKNIHLFLNVKVHIKISQCVTKITYLQINWFLNNKNNKLNKNHKSPIIFTKPAKNFSEQIILNQWFKRISKRLFKPSHHSLIITVKVKNKYHMLSISNPKLFKISIKFSLNLIKES